jgi:predicted aldo/keto reductase-like oxidoreductase
MIKVKLGKTGIDVSQLAFGTGTHGIRGRSDQSVLGIDGLSNLLQLGHSIGINFWDCADEYGTHPHIKKTLESVSRNDVVILTKTMSRRPESIKSDIHRYLNELGTDFIDIFLLHAMTHPKWTEKYSVLMDELSRMKEDGFIRAVGVSCHSLAALKAASGSDWVEVVMVRINIEGKNMDGSSRFVVPELRKLHNSGKGVIGMKVFGAGKLTNDPKMAIEYVISLGVVHAISIGMTNREMVLNNANILRGLNRKRSV